MDKLPVELLQHIVECANLTREELIANRLICRGLCAVFTPFAFRTVRTSHFTRKSFDNLCAIAQTPELAKHVVEYEYKLEKILSLRGQHEIDTLIAGEYDGEQLIDMTRRIHEDHQLFLGQQDILGTFYDTLSIFQSVPLFTRLEKIRMVDFDWPEPLSKMPPSRGHATAFARGFWSIVKTIAIVKPQCLPCLKTWEIDRFDYEVFLPYLLDEREQVDNDDGRSQFHTAISRLSVFRIRNVMSTDMYTVHGYGAQILTEALLLSGSKLQELSITDATNEHILPYSAFPFGFNEHLPFHRPELGTSGSMLVNLRKLELKGHRTIDIVTFAGMIMSLPPGVLQELGLDSLGLRDGVLWANFFRFIAPKTEWADATEEWQGSFMHYRIQSHILARTNADIDLFANDVEQLWTLQNNSQSKQHIRENVWRGLKLQKCILRALVDIPREHSLPGGGLGDVYADARPISHFELRKFERWMVKGLDTSEYCAIWLEL